MLKHCRGTPTGSNGQVNSTTASPRRSSSVPTTQPEDCLPEEPSEKCLIAVRANIVYYDDKLRKWLPCGTPPQEISKLQIIQCTNPRSYKILGQKFSNLEVTLDGQLLPGHRYNEATPTFHQWRDANQIVYGFSFSIRDDAVEFSKIMNSVLKALITQPDYMHSGTVKRSPSTPVTSQLHVETTSSVKTCATAALSRTSLNSGSSSSSELLLYAYPEEAELNLSSASTNQNCYILSPEITIQQQTAKMFAVRDNSRFQSTPNLAAMNFYDNSYTQIGRGATEGHFIRQNNRPCDGLQLPGGTEIGRPVSPRRIILRGVSPNQHQNTWTRQQQNQTPPQIYSPPEAAGSRGFRPTGVDINVRREEESLINFQSSPQPIYKQTSSNEKATYSHQLAAAHVDTLPAHSHYTVQPEPVYSLPKTQQQIPVDDPYRSDSKNNLLQESQEVNTSSMAPVAPPPPPPPIPADGIPPAKNEATTPESDHMSSLAAALQSAKLKKAQPKIDTSGLPPKMVGAKAVLMEEMQRKLAKRKAKADGEGSPPVAENRLSPFHTISRSHSTSPAQTHLSQRTLRQSVSSQPLMNGERELLPRELELLKQELLVEIRQDLDMIKHEILNAIQAQK